MIRVDVTKYIDLDETFPTLAGRRLQVITSDENPAESEVYVNKKVELAKKHGMTCQVIRDPHRVEDLQSTLGRIVQLPSSKRLTHYAQHTMSPNVDVDGYTNANRAALYSARRPVDLRGVYVPATAYGVMRFIEAFCGKRLADPKNVKVAVFGRSDLVGKPLTKLLQIYGYRVESFDSRYIKFRDNDSFDIIVIATGKSFSGRLIEKMITTQGLIIDVGIHRSENGLHGDLFPATLQRLNTTDKLQYVSYTPVPGGVGRLTTWSIFKQLAEVGLDAT